jgi:two-component system, cell cycle sensor histidine kinase and response regulator CckA
MTPALMPAEDQASNTVPLEAGRIAALHRYAILDTASERAFDRIVKLAAQLLDVPIALVSLVDEKRQWFKARHGLDATETPRDIAFCDFAIRGRDLLIVPDALCDARFHDNPLVTGDPHIRFYAGAPLLTSDGYALGTLCALDRKPRELDDRQAAILATLAEQVVHELEVRLALGELYTEVTERHRAARTLRSEGARLDALLNATGTAVISADADGRVASLNRAATAMFGLAANEGVGWSWARLVSTDLDLMDCDGRARSGEGRGLRKDGSDFPIHLTRASCLDAENRPACAVLLRDISEQRRAEETALRHAEVERGQEKLAALGRLAGGVAHEMNNLLQPVIGLTELELSALPQAGTEQERDTRENLEMVLECGQQMRCIVRKILTFARKDKPEAGSVDFLTALRGAISFVRDLLPPGIRIDEAIPGEASGAAVVDAGELTQIMMNLAVNAGHAMHGRGTLSIDLRRTPLATEAEDIGIQPGTYFIVTVADTGHGMDAATAAQIFEPFFTTKPVGEGTGLGLSMVYGVLRDWKGTVTVESMIGHSTKFTLYIPVAET